MANNNNNNISISKLSEILSVSTATIKNWIKLNKIKPDYIEGIPYFKKDYVNMLILKLKSKSSDVLKSRRNKKFISGSCLYKDYISQNSKNAPLISDLLNYISEKEIVLSISEICYIIANCAKQLLKKEHDALIDDLIDDKKSYLEFVKKYPDIFKIKYTYKKDEDTLGLLYISLLNLGDRKAQGVYYTPEKIVQKAIKTLDLKGFKDKKIIDPCCGSGNFLLQLPDNIKIENIYGNDVDFNAVKIARINMALKYRVSDIKILYKNFTNKDFLIDEFEEFDCIIGNPPWGANFSLDTKKMLKSAYTCANCKNIESYDVFIEKALSLLNFKGCLTFILPEAILTTKNHETIRNLILNKTNLTYLEYIGNMFNKVNCPSIILQLEYTNSPLNTKGLTVISNKKSHTIKVKRKITSEVFNFTMNDDEYKIYQKIINPKNKLYLKNNAIFALGLVTGNNKKYLSNKKSANNEIVLKGSDIEKFKIKTPTNYIAYNPQNFQQVAPNEYYRAKEKLFYKFISKELVFAYDNNQILSLNSCNILIPKIKGLDIKYIMAILNSKIAQFVFEKKYNSIKVLRSHIEDIPIPFCDKKEQNKIIKLVDNKNYAKLENEICRLYDLAKEEYEIIKNS